MKRYTRTIQLTAWMLLLVLTAEWINPLRALALTTGPTQPEMQSFEPVGTSDMVDMFSGDFVYNIPLMDVEGYPVNISYHGGVNMEQEASWVGLGWNINPGEVNRTVRGIPDDFNGDTLSKEFHIKDEKTLRVGIGIGGEIIGSGDPFLNISASLGADVNISNYRGVSCDINLGGGVSVFHSASVGVNIGVGSQTGADIDYNANLSLSTSQFMSSDISGGIGVGVSQGYSTRSGIKDQNFTFSANISGGGNSSSESFTNTIPIGVKNIVPVVTNSSTMNSIMGRIKLGGEVFWCLPYGTINAMFSKVHYNNDGSKDAYGYAYMQNAQHNAPGNTSVMDFTRDRDGMFNMSMQYLPPANMTYDIYSVNGQGTGGMFRPYRNDFGSVYDPFTTSSSESNSASAEAGIGDVFELGLDLSTSHTEIKSGPWTDYLRSFYGNTSGSIYESVFLKQGGELTSVDPQYFLDIHGLNPIDPTSLGSLPATKANSSTHRDARGNLVYYFTATEASISGIGTNPNIVSYTSTDGFASSPTPSADTISRISSNPLNRKKDDISEIVQLQKDGRRYVYGIPAINHIQKEATFSVDPATGDDLGKGLVTIASGDDGTSNNKGMDNYYSSTVTPSYVHSYLLTSVLSADYVDITGDGVTDDDLGSYTKLNYTLKDSDYRWRAPYESNKAQYSPGFWSEPRDDKGSYLSGSREEWLLHSIETRNFVAEFFTSQRNDACGSVQAITGSGKYAVAPYNSDLSAPTPSYKLDSIKLYNKHDRFINGANAIPIKTVYLMYSDSLCKGIPNAISPDASKGKLTLGKIYFKYGNSEKSMISPYQFSYGFNPDYDLAAKDRWGGYKPNNTAFTNYEFPFVDQNDTADNTYATAWSLTKIQLPSGGCIEANYEADDYAFVQDKPADEMFMVKGVGNGPTFNPSSQLYANKNSPYLYLYFQRRTSGEIPSLSFADNYFKGQTLLYYNFDVKLLSNKNVYEPIKGYADISDIGICSDNSTYGYIKLKPKSPTGGGATLNPVCYTALNTARYSLPQIMFPGSDPDESDLLNVLAGLKGAFEELISITKSPIVRFVKNSDAKTVNLSKSFVRLQSPGLRKKGGGQRVKSLLFHDSWSALAGGNEQDATYGKKYDYTIKDDIYGVISSGVASYEPMIGGDENPLRQPVPYIVQSSSNFPPNDAVGLYQEEPIGESLYPGGTVGYRKISVQSIHADVGKSSQGLDVYQFYTAKDFPAQLIPTQINAVPEHHFDLFSQENKVTATQGYSLIFNDMHGKPKSVEHYVKKISTGAPQMISYQLYNYKTSGGLLDNNVNCLVYDPGSGAMKMQNKQLGVEEDVTIDTREKDEDTKNSTFNMNLNVSGLAFFVVPIPFAFNWGGDYHNQFRSATVTKVVQQYGILDNVQAFNEGSVTTQRNEVFDPETGQVVISSINNEYHDKEYSMNIPAYWCYEGMSPAYSNIKFEADVSSMDIDTNRMANFINGDNLHVGDQLVLDYTDNDGTPHETIAFVMGTKYVKNCGGIASDNTLYSCCKAYILPRFPLDAPGWTVGSTITSCHLKVVNSGAKNIVGSTAESYTTFENPIGSSNKLNTAFDSVINIHASTFCDSNTVIIHQYFVNPDTVNPYAIGERGIYRLLSEYTYLTDRIYDGTTLRNSGLFSASSFFGTNVLDPFSCSPFPYNYLKPDNSDPNWHRSKTISKWSPYGKEVENIDAVGNYSTAIFGYNQDLPVAAVANAKQGQVLAEGFEDFDLLQYIYNLMGFTYSPLGHYFSTAALGSSTVYDTTVLFNTSDLSIISGQSHTGTHSLLVPVSSGGITGVYGVPLPLNSFDYSAVHNRYNSYYPFGVYTLSSANEYLPFQLAPGNKYILSYWIKQSGSTPNLTTYSLNDSCGVKTNTAFYPMVRKSNIIDGWQQVEVVFNVPIGTTSVALRLPVNYYVDDVRAYPSDANMKSFVYDPVNEKLMASLDENNFALLYEYDQEGKLVRVKKETEKGIMTVSESRSNNPIR